MDSGAVVMVVGFWGCVVALMTPFEAQSLRLAAKRSGRQLGRWRALALAGRNITASIGAFVFVIAAFGFGIPYLLGDMVGLPWFTVLPSVLLGAFAARAVNRRLTATALGPEPMSRG